MTVTYADLVAAIGGKESSPNKCSVQCPAHDDDRESLLLSKGTRQELWLKCYADCKFQDIIKKYKEQYPHLNWGKDGKDDVQWIWYEFEGHKFVLPVKLGKQAPEKIEKVYFYKRNGQYRKAKVRFSGKEFVQYLPPLPEKPNNWRLAGPKNGNAEELPFNYDDVEQAAKDGKYVTFSEGEKDCENAILLLNMTGTTFGGVSALWKPEYDELFQGVKGVIIFADNDLGKKENKGLKYAEHIAANLHRLGIPCKIIVMPGGHKDFTDWRDAGGTKKQMLDLIASTAPWVPPVYEVPATMKVEAPAAKEPDKNDKTYEGISHFLDTDTRNAERFKHFYGHIVRYVPGDDEFRIYNGKYWETDRKNQIQEMAKDISRRIVADIGNQDYTVRADLEKWAKKTESARNISSLIKLATSIPEMVALPEQFDSRETRHLFNCYDGTLDLNTGKLNPHDPNDYLSHYSNARHKVGEPELWLSNLHRCFAGDQEMIDYFQMILGHCLTGQTYFQAFQHWHGKPATGKSIIQAILTAIGGSYVGNMDPQSMVLNTQRSAGAESDIADTAGKRLIFVSEVKKHHRLDESVLKAITGGDIIRVKKMHANKYDLKGCAKLVFTGNERPQISNDDATHRRMVEIGFYQILDKSKWIQDFDQVMLAEEGGEILHWLQQGAAKATLQNLLKFPAHVEAGNSEWRKELNLVAQWLEEKVEKNDYNDTLVDEAWKSFYEWVKEGGYKHQFNKIGFGKLMKKEGWESTVTTVGRVYKGMVIV